MGVDANGGAVEEAQQEPELVETEAELENDDAGDIEPLFKQAKKKLKKGEVDAFWDDAVDKQKGAPIKPDIITYDEARQLGLKLEDD